jgi:two-component system response regulator FixJ
MSPEAARIVAVVDDDPGVRDSLRFLLEAAGHTVQTYDSAGRFLAEADPLRLGCLVLDQQMPRMTGLEMLASLRGRRVAMPVLLVTSIPRRTIAERATALGVVRVLEKPLVQDDLLGEIDRALAQGDARR